MTLTTTVYITAPADPVAVWAQVCAALDISTPHVTMRPDADPAIYTINNTPGQGAPAWVRVTSRYDRQPLEVLEVPDGDLAAYVTVSLDTAYRGPTNTHPEVIRRLAATHQLAWRADGDCLVRGPESLA